MNDDEGHDLELVMPFVTTVSHGGPHDDDSYCAGWEMGALDIRLNAARHLGLGLPTVTVKRDNLPQLDLIAMKAGARMIVADWDNIPHNLDDETRRVWAMVTFEYTA